MCALAIPAASFAQTYPVRPIRLIVPYPPGGPTDFVGRVVGQKLSSIVGQQVVVDNRPGAGTVIGSELVARAAPDGYTLLFGTGGGTFLAPLILPSVSYDPLKDFAPVAMLVQSPQVLVVHPSVPVTNVRELIALAKAKPGTLNYASVGNGTSPHLGGELLKSLTNTNIVHVPYKGTAPAMTDLIAGQVHLMALGPLAGGLLFDTYGSYAWLYIGSFGIGLCAALIMSRSSWMRATRPGC